MMLGGTFAWHPKFQKYTIRVIDPQHPSVAGLPKVWVKEDECYFQKELYPGIRTVLAQDITTLDQADAEKIKANAGPIVTLYPAAWYQQFDGGTIWITALGHSPTPVVPSGSSGCSGSAPRRRSTTARSTTGVGRAGLGRGARRAPRRGHDLLLEGLRPERVGRRLRGVDRPRVRGPVVHHEHGAQGPSGGGDRRRGRGAHRRDRHDRHDVADVLLAGRHAGLPTARSSTWCGSPRAGMRPPGRWSPRGGGPGTSFQVPEGSLTDGGVYSWTVLTKDPLGEGAVRGPGSSW